MKYLFLLVLASASQVLAVDKSHDFNPADPTIWHEKPPSTTAQEQHKALCATFPSAECLNAAGNQSDIEHEKQRREDKRRYHDQENHFKH